MSRSWQGKYRARDSKKVQKSKRKREPNAYDSKIVKPPTKTELRNTLQHAILTQDHEAFEDYDEWEF